MKSFWKALLGYTILVWFAAAFIASQSGRADLSVLLQATLVVSIPYWFGVGVGVYLVATSGSSASSYRMYCKLGDYRHPLSP
jgi:hypothetical protein